jgi:hypothetical protein
MITSIVIYIWSRVPAIEDRRMTVVLGLLMVGLIGFGLITDIGILRAVWRQG